MRGKDIITKLKKSRLLGRGGAGFPTGLKWEMVNLKKAERKYIICNASEGEPNVFKDGFILANEPEEVIEGIKIALKTFTNSFAYIYLRADYYKKFKEKLEKLTKGLPIALFKKRGGYFAGEETAVIEVIEGKRPEPRIKPPWPTQVGLWGCPTLVNNVETFYYVAKIAKGEYKRTRFYSISGEVKNGGVYELSENYSISQVLKETDNWPDFDPPPFGSSQQKNNNRNLDFRSKITKRRAVDFFVQAGGGAIGEILLPEELNQSVKGTGAIIIFDPKKTKPFSLLKKWANFFLKENCDKCLPCREGAYRIGEMLKKEKVDKEILEDLFFVLEKTSLCSLGKGMVVPFRSLINKMRQIWPEPSNPF